MALSEMVSRARPDWSAWYVNMDTIYTKAGESESIDLRFYLESTIKDTISAEIEYHYNGEKTELHYLGMDATVRIEIGDTQKDIFHTIKIRLQNNSHKWAIMIPPQRVKLNCTYMFVLESVKEYRLEQDAEKAINSESAKQEAEMQRYKQSLENYKKEHNISDENLQIPENAYPEGIYDSAPALLWPNNSIFSKVAGLFSSQSNGTLSSLVASANTSRTSNLNLESLLGAEISRSADSIVNRIIGRNPNMFQASAGRFLSQSVERFGEALTKGRIDGFEDAFTSVLGGKNGAIGFASDIGNQVVGGLLQSGLGKLFGGTKTSTTSYESARSIAAGNALGMSRGQQAAEMLTQLQKGQRNL